MSALRFSILLEVLVFLKAIERMINSYVALRTSSRDSSLRRFRVESYRIFKILQYLKIGKLAHPHF